MYGDNWIDEDGQPVSAVNAKRVIDRDINVLIGVCIGVLSDGSVNQIEAEFLQEWLAANQHISEEWPANVIYQKLQAVFDDGVMDADEEEELLALLVDVVGGNFDEETHEKPSTTLPYDNPAPAMSFTDHNFVLTGKFESGGRKEIEEIIQELGGNTAKDPSSRTHYLIVGAVGSRDWQFASFGRKIQKAIALREKGSGIAIFSEATFDEILEQVHELLK